jgi:zinc D-Ala-D-Ala carboxypeptidase
VRRFAGMMLIAIMAAVIGLAVPAAPASAATAIEQRYQQLGGPGGTLGRAQGGEVCGLRSGGCAQQYERGVIYWSPASGAQAVWGAIRGTWAAHGLERGGLGYPVTGERCGIRDGGCYQWFQGGLVMWSPASGVHAAWGAMLGTWAAQGYERGPLGYPASGELCFTGGAVTCRQYFQGGLITWNPQTGASVTLGIDPADSTAVVVNKQRPLNPADYAPAALTPIAGQALQAEAAGQFRRLMLDAQAAGVPMTAVSGYRTYQTQASLYAYYISLYGQAAADSISARPGYSEHQTGLAIDIGNPNGACALQSCFEGTPAGAWAAQNAYRYGFIVRYPNGYTGVTGYAYEPWHLRYVGPGIAADMRNRGIPTMEQYFGLPAAPNY